MNDVAACSSSPLFDLQAERGFIGSIAAESLEDIGKARSLLDASLVVPERMYLPAHQEVLAEARKILEQGRPVEALSLHTALRASPVVESQGGFSWLMGITALDTGIVAALPTYATAIRECALRRKLLSVAREGGIRAQGTERGEDTLVWLQRELAAITLDKRSIQTVRELLAGMVDEMEEISEGRKAPGPIPSGFPSLDAIIGGLQKTLIVVGAQPGVGKSALLASITQQVAMAGRRIGIFSLEDEARWLAWRLWSHESGVSQFVMRNQRLTPGDYTSVAKGFGRLTEYGDKILIDDRNALTPQELVQTARHMVTNLGCEAIIVDHLGELRFGRAHADRHDLEIAEGLSDLRGIAKRYSVPVIVACHLRRRADGNPGGEPTLSDFANSAAIERQARVALGLAREKDSDTLQVCVMKNTNGPAGVKVDLRFVGTSAMVRDCEEKS
jgi:replicative DNA helicase